MDHVELVENQLLMEKLTAADRAKQAKKNRLQQLKLWAEREKQFEKDDKKKKETSQKKIKKIYFSAGETLLDAVIRNDITEVKLLLDNNLSPDSAREDGLTALHQCCLDDLHQIMHLLVERKANVNVMDQERWTPLHAAAACGNVDTCRYLISKGADLLAVNADGQLPYELCTNDATLDVLEAAMVAKGLTQDDVEEARGSPERDMMASLQQALLDKRDLTFVGKHGESLLHIAAANGYANVVQLLLDNHASVNEIDDDGWRPIHSAAYWNEFAVLELLAYAGADLNARTHDGLMPYDLTNDADVRDRIKSLREEMWNKPPLRAQSSAIRKGRRSSSVRHTGTRDKPALSQKDVQNEAEKLRNSFSFEETEDLAFNDSSVNSEVNCEDVNINFGEVRACDPAEAVSAKVTYPTPSSSSVHDNGKTVEIIHAGAGNTFNNSAHAPQVLASENVAFNASLSNDINNSTYPEIKKLPTDADKIPQQPPNVEQVKRFKAAEVDLRDSETKKCCCLIA